MLAGKYRLKGTEPFELVKEKGTLHQTPDFGVNVLEKDDSKTSRFGFVISKKVDKLAVNRNRVKRAMSESVRRNVKEVEYGYDMVFLAKKSLMSQSTDEIMKKVEKWLKEVEL